MTELRINGKTEAGRSWSGVQRGQRKRPVEWMIERGIFLVSLSAILMVFLIFFFVGREALPIVFGQESSAAQTEVFRVEDYDKIPSVKLKHYLGLTADQFQTLDRDAKLELMALKVDTAAQAGTDKDSALNTVEWRYLLRPHQWTGYDKPEYI